MVARTVLAALLAVVVVTAGVSAAVAAAPPDDTPADEEAPDDRTPDETSAADGRADDESDDADAERGPPSDAADDAGPPVDLPDPVPDFVGDVHSAIDEFLAGGLDGSLGDVVSAVTPGEESDDGETMTETPENEDQPEGTDADTNAVFAPAQ